MFLNGLEKNNQSEKIKTYVFGTNEDIEILFNENLSSDNDDSPYNMLTSILFDEWIRWYNYISENDPNEKVVYHTYHSTKGLEYENVAIILDDSTGLAKDNLKNYLFTLVNCDDTINKKLLDSNKDLRNLLYVAITRSYKNLFILNNTTLSNEQIKKIFKV